MAFVLGPFVLLLLFLFGPILHANDKRVPMRRPTAQSRGEAASKEQWTVVATYVVMGWCELAAAFFMVDAIRRKYRGSRPVALAVAAMGLLSLGMTSVVYYVIWGRLPLVPREQIYGQGLCPECMAGTLDEEAPPALAHDVFYGTRYMGASQSCDRCHSVIRTLWFWLLLPLFPMGSYRLVFIDHQSFVGRRTRLSWRQVRNVYGVVAIVVTAITLVCLVWNRG
jgi:hypothetical protein